MGGSDLYLVVIECC